MTSRPAALFVVALVVGGVVACGHAGETATPSTGPPPSVLITSRPAGAGTIVETLVEAAPHTSDGGDGTTTYEELVEPAPADADDPTTTSDEDDPPPPSTTSSTTKPHPVVISTKAEPTGPGVPPIPAYTQTEQEVEYFNCVTLRESGNNPRVINLSSGAAGLFQFLQSTWDIVARRVGRPDLVGVNPALASVATQRYLAHVLYLWQGSAPWVSDGCQIPGRPTTTTTSTTSPTTSPTTPSTDPSTTDEPTTTTTTSLPPSSPSP